MKFTRRGLFGLGVGAAAVPVVKALPAVEEEDFTVPPRFIATERLVAIQTSPIGGLGFTVTSDPIDFATSDYIERAKRRRDKAIADMLSGGIYGDLG